jgi:glycosyltransferase involved in cell wall biosynthesis
MVAGLPIVSFDCPFGPGEIIENEVDGLLVPPEDADALAEAMARMMQDADLRRRFGQKAQQNVRRFERSRIMERWDDLVADVV